MIQAIVRSVKRSGKRNAWLAGHGSHGRDARATSLQQAQLSDDDDRWRAVLARDAASDGRFVYAVRSTGVYCRPTCPSRRPRRERVEFFPDAAAAERAGFRACLRCRPAEARAAASNPFARRIAAACRTIEEHADEPIALADLAREAGLSPYHFQRTFKRIVGVTPKQYAAACRERRLRGALHSGAGVTAATFAAGYGSGSRVYERSADRLGMTPAAFGRGGAGARIAFATAACALGRLLVAATERGVCAIELGDDDRRLEADLRRQFPAATIEAGGGRLDDHVRAIVRHLDGVSPGLDLPLDVRATAFQRRVWLELQRIPRGQRRTYTQIARSIGQPAATRAVARACATNPVALAVPCHRVVRTDGRLGGYRWGLKRKVALLEREQTAEGESRPGG
jgi:AraC family transcriptional regulator of adaptative response/methylated-DNA-[protein]-cysteine methyltransferase